MYIVSVTCHQHAPCIPQFILPLSEFCILISLILLCGVQHNVNIFEILELKKLSSSLAVSVKSMSCHIPEETPKYFASTAKASPIFTFVWWYVIQVTDANLEMFMEKACFSNCTYSNLLWTSCNICLKVLRFPMLRIYHAFVPMAGW